MLTRIKNQKSFSKERISDFYKRYLNRMVEVKRLEIEQKDATDSYLTWHENYHLKSKLIKEIYEVNEVELHKFIYPIIEGNVCLNNRMVEAFLEEIIEMRNEMCEDSLITLEVLKAIISFYEKKPPKEPSNYIVALGMAALYEDNFGVEFHYEKAIEYNNRVIEYKDQFPVLTSVAQQRMSCAFMNRIISESYRKKINIDNLIKYLKEAECFYTNEEYRRISEEELEYYYSSCRRLVQLQILSVAKEKGKCSAGFIIEAAEQAIVNYERRRKNGRSDDSIESTDDLNYFLACLYLKKMTPNEVYERMKTAYENLNKTPNYEDPLYHKCGLFGFYVQVIPEMLVVLQQTDYSKEQIIATSRKIAEEVFYTYGNIPFDKRNEQTNNYLLMAFRLVLPYFGITIEEMEIVHKAIVSKDNITAIHVDLSIAISKEIVKSIIMNKPYLFIGFEDCESESEVRKNAEKILRYTYGAAIMYDIGKLVSAKIINIKHRNKTDVEVALIQEHVEIGEEILKKNSALSLYCNIAKGHHKFYNGMGGYPVSYEGKRSQDKIWTDIFHLCDKIDSMTDIVGRKQNEISPYESFIEEIKNGRGTNYNPELVDLFDESVSLKGSIQYLINEGGSTMLYDIYRKTS